MRPRTATAIVLALLVLLSQGAEAATSRSLASVLRRSGLALRHSLRVGKVEYRFSDPFLLGAGRPAFVAEIRSAGAHGPELSHRVFYRSKSQGVYRLLPALNLTQRRYGGDFDGLPTLDKGPGEEHLTAPLAAQDLLARLAKSPRSDVDGFALAAKVVPTYRSPTSYARYHESPERPRTRASLLFEDRRGVPVIRAEMAPDYRAPLGRGTASTTLSGSVEVLRYPSKNGRLVYTLHVDRGGHAMIASVTRASSGVNRFGLPKSTVSAGDVAMPRWEYPFQIPPGGAGAPHARDEAYASSWPYLRSRPEIREFYRVTGRKMPPAESPHR